MPTVRLMFARFSGPSDMESVLFLNLDTDVEMDEDAAHQALRAAVTEWVCTTEEGRKELESNDGEFSFLNFCISGWNEELKPILKSHGLAVVNICEIVPDDNANADSNLIDEEMMERLIEAQEARKPAGALPVN